MGDQQYSSQPQRQGNNGYAALGLGKSDAWEYRSLQQLQAEDPSVQDGMDPAKVRHWRRQYTKVIATAGMSLKIPMWGIAVAALLCNRFFSRKSMKRNDRFVIAAACLHLAAKMEEAPKSAREVVKECLRVRFGSKSKEFDRLQRSDELEKLKEETLVAERAVLYALDFNLNVSHPYRHLVTHMSNLGLLGANADPGPYKNVMQNTWNFLNDSIRTLLCLQYSPEVICAGVLWTANVLNTRAYGPEGDIMNVVRQRDPHATFWSHFHITPDQAESISSQILDLYEGVKTAGSGRPLSPPPPATMPAPHSSYHPQQQQGGHPHPARPPPPHQAPSSLPHIPIVSPVPGLAPALSPSPMNPHASPPPAPRPPGAR